MGLAYTSQDTGTFGLHYAKTVRLSSRNSLTIACSFRLLLSPDHFFTTLNHCCAARSLGGALSTLLAMKLASSWTVKNVIKVPEPIINISVASPYVGGQAFSNAIQVRL
jgi:hypothetical protein